MSRMKLDSGMTVAQLIDELGSYPDDAIVVFSCSYGDHSRTQQALPITSVEEMEDDCRVVKSAYSESGLAIEEQEDSDDDQECEDEAQDVVVLRS